MAFLKELRKKTRNEEQEMIAGVCGYGFTGSGAVLDLLQEFDEVAVGQDFEFSFLYDPNGIIELEHRLVTRPIRYYSADAGIKSFIKMMNSHDLKRTLKKAMPIKQYNNILQSYLSDLIVYTFDGCLWHYDRRQCGRIKYFFKYFLGGKYLRIFDVLHLKQPQKFFNDKLYLTVHDERFYTATQRFTSNLIDVVCNTRKGIIALDQPFPSNNPKSCYKFFDQKCVAIVVNRDPRDLYLLLKMKSRGWELRFTPTNSVEDFILYYKNQMDVIQNYKQDVLYIQFEDLIYKYKSTCEAVKNFLGIKNHVFPKRYFNPDISIANTQLNLRYPEFGDDIKKIESELSLYLYPFDVNKVNLNNKPWIYH